MIIIIIIIIKIKIIIIIIIINLVALDTPSVVVYIVRDEVEVVVSAIDVAVGVVVDAEGLAAIDWLGAIDNVGRSIQSSLLSITINKDIL